MTRSDEDALGCIGGSEMPGKLHRHVIYAAERVTTPRALHAGPPASLTPGADCAEPGLRGPKPTQLSPS